MEEKRKAEQEEFAKKERLTKVNITIHNMEYATYQLVDHYRLWLLWRRKRAQVQKWMIVKELTIQ